MGFEDYIGFPRQKRGPTHQNRPNKFSPATTKLSVEFRKFIRHDRRENPFMISTVLMPNITSADGRIRRGELNNQLSTLSYQQCLKLGQHLQPRNSQHSTINSRLRVTTGANTPRMRLLMSSTLLNSKPWKQLSGSLHVIAIRIAEEFAHHLFLTRRPN